MVMKTHKERLLHAMMSDKVVSQKKFPKIQLHTRISELRKDGLSIEGNHLVAHCNGCGSFIKNIPYKEPTLYFGKYKDKKVSDIQDLGYLQWLIDKSVVKANIREAVVNQIQKIKLYCS